MSKIEVMLLPAQWYQISGPWTHAVFNRLCWNKYKCSELSQSVKPCEPPKQDIVAKTLLHIICGIELYIYIYIELTSSNSKEVKWKVGYPPCVSWYVQCWIVNPHVLSPGLRSVFWPIHPRMYTYIHWISLAMSRSTQILDVHIMYHMYIYIYIHVMYNI